MNRDIKFRAWHEGLNRMCDADFINFEGECYDETNVCAGTYYEKDNKYKLMQYTGLKDKNNKEIYDRDIITGYWYEKVNDYDSELWSDIAKVYFDLDKGMWVAEEFKTTGEIYPLYDYCEFVNVIGNIYENPSLLE